MSLLQKLRNKKLQKAVLTSIFGLSLGFLVNDIAYARTNIGDGSSATGSSAVAVGDEAKAEGNDTVVVGSASTASGYRATSVGYNIIGVGNYSTVVGIQSTAKGTDSVAIGSGSHADTDSSVAIGNVSYTSGDYAIAIGDYARAENSYVTVIGHDAEASGKYSVVLGEGAGAEGEASIAIGHNSYATKADAVAMGTSAGATGLCATAIGNNAEADGDGSTAIGLSAIADGSYSTAIGNAAYALADSSIAIGYNSVANEEYIVSFGSDDPDNGFTRRIVNISAGINDTDAANVSQLISSGSYDNDTKKLTLSSNSGSNVVVDLSSLPTGSVYTAGDGIIITGDVISVKKDGAVADGNTDLVTGDTVYDAVKNKADITYIDTELEGKANADASNVAGHTAEWGAAIGTGVVEEGNGELVTGGTVYNVVKDKADITYVDTQLGTKADIDLGNITVDGQNVIKNIVKGSVKLENGINTTVSSTENDDGSLTYKVNVEGNGKAEAGNTGLINGDTLYNTVNEINENITNVTEGINTELDGKANADASNVADHTAEWGEAIGTGAVEDGNGELVTGDTVYEAVKDKADKDYVDEQLSGKADADLGNLTDEGKDVIKDIAKDTVKVEDGLNTTVSSTENADGSISYQVNVEGNGKAEAGNTGLINGDTLYNTVNNITNNFNTELEGKANADASNVADHTAEWGAAIGTGVVEEGNGELVTGGTVYDAVKDKIDSDLGNLTDDGKNVIGDIAKDALQDDLDGKANIDASNIETDKWADKLGTGTISAGDNNLVTGNTVYDAIKDLGSNSLVTSDGNTISVGKNDSATVIDVSKHNSDGSTENRVITGIETDASDMSSAANVGYVNNSVSQMANEFNRGLSELDSRMKKGVAGAAALAALNPLDYDPENKLNFAAGVGSYKGESAAALGMFYRPNENIMFSLGGAFGNGENMWNAGITFNLDKPNASTSKAAMARAIKTMAADNEALEAKAAEQDEKIALLTAQVEALMAAQKK